ncbi:MAG: RHS repeat-associated core domain-containing protein [Chloroflexota bacterium]
MDKPFGEIRSWWTSSAVTAPIYTLTKYTFTGQASYIIPVGDMDDPSTTTVTEGFGLMHYQSRFYDPALGRFTSADTIVPGGVQGYDRYAYVNNSPLNFVDPSGHEPKYGCYASTNGTCTNANGTPLSTGNGKGGRKEKEEEEGDPDLCEMIGEGCGGKGSGLNSPIPAHNPPPPLPTIVNSDNCWETGSGGYSCSFDVNATNIVAIE